MRSLFDLFAFLLLLAAAFGWINARFLHLPSNIGLLLMGVLASLGLFALDLALPGTPLVAEVAALLRRIDFYDAVMNGMLAFLLFAGGLHVDWQALRKRVGTVTMLATVGVLISTLTIGYGFWALAHLLGLQISLAWSLVFGALISPTDPVAVLSLLKSARVPQLLETEMAGESLFNDGVGVVLFTILLAVASSGDHVSVPSAVGMFLLEAIGGGVIGVAAGTIAFYAMRAIDDYVVEVFITLALVTVTYALAGYLHTSGPIAVVVAGLVIGERGPTHAMSETTQRYLFGFWALVDELLNAVLFLLIGLEILVIDWDLRYSWLAILVIPLALAARFISIGIPFAILRVFVRLSRARSRCSCGAACAAAFRSRWRCRCPTAPNGRSS